MSILLPSEIEPLCRAFVRGLEGVLGDKLYGVYLYGALAFPEGGAGGDVDYHVVLRDALTGEEKAGLKDLHEALGQEFGPPAWDMDGYYILLSDAQGSASPEHQFLPGVIDHSWALHRAHIHAGKRIVLYGPDPEGYYPVATWPQLEAALWHELDWAEKHLSEYPDYGILQLCRLMVSFQTRDVVVSKRFSAGWAQARFPQWIALIDAALNSYDRGHPAEDRQALASQIMPFHEFAMAQIYAAKAESSCFQPGGMWRQRLILPGKM